MRRVAVSTLATVAAVLTAAVPGASGVAEAQPDDDYSVQEFVQLARTTFPELPDNEAVCIGELVVDELSAESLQRMFTDPDAPEKSSPDEQGLLVVAIDECVERASAVDVVAGWAESMVTGQPRTYSLRSPLPYDSLRCIDEEIGDLAPGEAFFSMYQRPVEFLRQVGDAFARCVEEGRARELLSGFADEFAEPRLVRPGEAEWTPTDPVGTHCLAEVLLGGTAPTALSTSLEQVIIAATQEQAAHLLDDVSDAAASCGLPLSRRYGQ